MICTHLKLGNIGFDILIRCPVADTCGMLKAAEKSKPGD